MFRVMLIHDSLLMMVSLFFMVKGCKIQASVKKSLIYRFERRITEGRVYGLSNFVVAENHGDYRYTRHPCRLHFCMSTDVKAMNDAKIDIPPYSFVSFAEFIDEQYAKKYIVGNISHQNCESLMHSVVRLC